MERTIFHIDVNSAFLSWSAIEKLKSEDSIDLRKIPSIIGGNQANRHGIVLAKSIPAKAYQIETGEPISNAIKKCPNLIIEAPNHQLYKDYSTRLMQLLYTFNPDIEQASIDECYMDFTSLLHQYPSAINAAEIIKDTVFEKLGFTVNIGISTNKLLAKMASDFKKPNLVHTLYPEEIPAKLWPLPVKELYMVGKSTLTTLQKLEIQTIGDLAESNVTLLSSHLKSHGRLIWEYANGIDETPVNTQSAELKGIGNSTTLPKDIETYQEVKPILLNLAEKVGKRLRDRKQSACMISVEIKYNTFISVSHQMQLTVPVNTNQDIYQKSCILFNELWDGIPIRLLGIRTSKLVSESEPTQLNLFEINSNSQKNKNLDKALDEIRTRYGKNSIIRGSQL
ncbi:Y-family DNA polymerase [Anaerosacchariphilus polymeriproducens]|uniref:DNA polymerase IV n=1 Tax=Anaerosacchariphilus polymeriproducens TaxID=1812858 RepID=A0A371B019_9FIRM|nr:DNA polymerase IV [Anaerosacchariphilus polymeriproducens]RDU25092.1 DNA polymerase IV [Anaerosacchariphilus polymeriproducens]